EALGITPAAAVGLITGASPPEDPGFAHAGVDWTPLLRTIVSGELDADRMDYLVRDSFYTGVNYGRYDMDWIISNLSPAVKEGRAYLALGRAAAFAFEDFLLSRYHMFISVYYHHTSVNFDHMLRRYYEDAPGEFEIPADPEAFLSCDDVALWYTLRRSMNPWAARISRRQGFKLLAQFTERDVGYDLDVLRSALVSGGFEHFVVESRGVLSKYFGEGAGPSLYIVDMSTGRLTEVARYTPLYQRYSGAVRLTRVYVRPDQIGEARKMLVRLLGQGVSSP
ncbi:MAG TPA: phosphohydrolase, partial [Myxococcaceae bacterium]|nr:phosphohydrolase [Myxococcaceae bacterium]